MTLIGGLLADLVAANRALPAEVRRRLPAAELARQRDGPLSEVTFRVG